MTWIPKDERFHAAADSLSRRPLAGASSKFRQLLLHATGCLTGAAILVGLAGSANAAASTFQGLFQPPGTPAPGNSGFFSATVSPSGAYSAKLLLAGKSYSAAGKFQANGSASNYVAHAGPGALTLLLQLDPVNGAQLTGTISNGTWSASLMSLRTGQSPQASGNKYTFLLVPGSADSSQQPAGASFALVKVSASGLASFAGALADGTSISASGAISAQGLCPLYVPAYAGKGLLLGWLGFTNAGQSDVNGQLVWSKPAQANAKSYAGGFTTSPGVVGSRFDSTGGSGGLSAGAKNLWLASGGLPSPILEGFAVDAKNKVSSTNKLLKLSFLTASGQFQGSVANPFATGAGNKTVAFKGAVLQNQGLGAGFFLGATQDGLAFVGNAPVSWAGTPWPAAPSVVVPPSSQTAVAGTTPVFTVSASGTAPLSYQWLFGGSPLPGASGTALWLTNVQSSQAGNYAVRVANAFGAVTSQVAVLTVNSGQAPLPATLLVSTFFPSDTATNGQGGPAGAGVLIYTNEVAAAVTGDDGTATLTVPAGLVQVRARLYPSSEGQAQISLMPGTNAALTVVLQDGKELAEDLPLVLWEVRNGVLDPATNSLTFQFLDAAHSRTGMLTSLDQVELLDPQGGPSVFLEQNFMLTADGQVACTNVGAVQALLANRTGAISINVHGTDSAGSAYDGTVSFYLGQFRVLGQLLAPPSFPDLNVAGLPIQANLLGSSLAFQTVADAAGNFEFDLLPAGVVEFTSQTVTNGLFFYAQGDVVISQDLALGLNLLQTQDVTNGVPGYTVSPLGPSTPSAVTQKAANQALRLQQQQKAAPPAAAAVPLDTGSSSVSASATADAQDTPVSQSAVLFVPKGTKTVTLTYDASSQEYPYWVGQQSIYNDVWSVEVRAGEGGEQLFTISRQVNSQLYAPPVWQSDGSTGPIKQKLDVGSFTANGDAMVTLSVSAMNVGDSALATSVTATLSPDDGLTIQAVVPDQVTPTEGDSTYYSIPRPGAVNYFERFFTLQITKPDTSTISNLKVTVMGQDTLMTLLDEGLGENVQQVDANTLKVRVSLRDYASTIGSQPPPAHTLTYRFNLSADDSGVTLQDQKDSGVCHGLWRMPDGFARFGPAGTSPGDAGRDAGGDDWCSRGTYNWLLANAGLVTPINDISGEHARNIGHATHQYGTDLDMYHFYTFPGAVSGMDNYLKLRAAVLLAVQTNSPDSAIRQQALTAQQQVAAWITATRNGIDALTGLDSVRALLYIKGVAGSGLPAAWGQALLTSGSTTVGSATLDLGLDTWQNNKYHPRDDHNDHVHVTLDRTQVDQ